MPPVGYMCARMQECDLPKARAIDFTPSPFFQRSHKLGALRRSKSDAVIWLLSLASLHDLKLRYVLRHQLNSQPIAAIGCEPARGQRADRRVTALMSQNLR